MELEINRKESKGVSSCFIKIIVPEFSFFSFLITDKLCNLSSGLFIHCYVQISSWFRYILLKYLLFMKLGSNPFPFTRFFVGLKQYLLDELQRFEEYCLFIHVPPMHRHQNQNVP
jgi:hypothetical protein